MNANLGVFRSLRVLSGYRHRVLEGVMHDIRQRYIGSVFGSLWAVLFPLLQLSIYAGLYTFIFKVRPSGLTELGYVVLVFSGLVPLMAFNEALKLGVNRAEVVERLGQSMVAQGKQLDMLAHPALEPAGLPDNLQLRMHLLRASAHADLGRIAPALQSINEARKLDNRSPEVWLAEVPIRIRSKSFAEALQAVDHLEEIHLMY